MRIYVWLDEKIETALAHDQGRQDSKCRRWGQNDEGEGEEEEDEEEEVKDDDEVAREVWLGRDWIIKYGLLLQRQKYVRQYFRHLFPFIYTVESESPEK